MDHENSFREQVADYIRREAEPRDKFGHQPRLYALTQLVGQGREYDDGVVYAAAWLHDLGVFYGHRPSDPIELASWDNTRYACEQAPPLLRSFGFPEAKVAAVVEAIRTHQPKAVPTSLEGLILRDADILEQLGAIGILRAVCKVGRDTRFATFSDVLPVLEIALEDLPARLSLERSRELALPRIEILRNFIRSVRDEAAGALF
jgi:uncharacterized protein